MKKLSLGILLSRHCNETNFRQWKPVQSRFLSGEPQRHSDAPPTIPPVVTAEAGKAPDLNTATPKSEASIKVSASESLQGSSGQKEALAKVDGNKKTLTIWEKVKREAQHYWDGTKLLGKEITISFKLALKMAAGHEMSRRETRQVGCTNFVTVYSLK